MTQNQLILKHLRHAGSITQREALMDYSIQSLTKRISELRKKGYLIEGFDRFHPTTRQRYKRYFLMGNIA